MTTLEEAKARLIESQMAYGASIKEVEEAQEAARLAEEALKAAEERLKMSEQEFEIAEKLDKWPKIMDGAKCFRIDITPREEEYSVKTRIENDAYVDGLFTDIKACQKYCHMIDFCLTVRTMALQLGGYLGYGHEVAENSWSLFMDKDKTLKAFNVVDNRMRYPMVTLMTKKVAETIAKNPGVIKLAKLAW